MSRPTTKLFYDSLHPKKDRTCSVYLRVTYERKIKQYPTYYSFKAADWAKVQNPASRDPYKTKRLELEQFDIKAQEIIKELKRFTFEGFESRYLENRDVKIKVSAAFEKYAKEYRAEGRIGTAVSFECANNSLEAYKPGLLFADVTPEFLKRYEAAMLKEGKSITTVGIYLRALRTIYNLLKLPKDTYPFIEYRIPSARNPKKALDMSAIKKIFTYKPKTREEGFYRDLWQFLYLCGGINVKDAVLLKWSNIKSDRIEFIRAKSIRTKKEQRPIVIPLTEDISKAFAKIGKKGSEYVLPLLDGSEDLQRQRAMIQQLTKMINKYINRISEELGIGKVTTYTARHSFATVLLRSGANVSLISEALGHSSIKTTELYLSGFDIKTKQDAFSSLTNFSKKK